MHETKQKEGAYSGERIKIMSLETPAEVPEAAKSPEAREATQSSEVAETAKISVAAETAESLEVRESAPPPEQVPVTRVTALPEITRTVEALPENFETEEGTPDILDAGGTGMMPELTEFLRRTKRAWLIAAGAILGVLVLVTVVKWVSERATTGRETPPQEQAVLDVTPESLMARCGSPAEDETKEIYPLVTRTMSYPGRENEKIVFAFSRTAEKKSDWLFLSMKKESGATGYDTTEAKIAALPCLAARK